jgi:hypothetical protein
MMRCLHKISPFLASAAGRMFAQRENVVDMRKAMDEGHLILADLPIGTLGPTAADSIGSFLEMQVFAAAMTRAQQTNTPSLWGNYIDESHRIAGRVLEAMLTNERKTGVLIALAYQSRDLFTGRARIALRNLGSSIGMNLHYDDASQLARESGGVLDAAQLQRQPVGSAWAFLDSHVLPVRLLAPRLPAARNHADEIIRYNLEHYYLPEEEYTRRVNARLMQCSRSVGTSQKRAFDDI